MKESNVNLLNSFKTLFSKVKEKFGRAELLDGTIIEWVGSLEEGSEIFEVVEDGLAPIADGEYETMDGMTISVEEGVVSSLEESAEEDEELEEDEDMESESEEEMEAETEEEEEVEAEVEMEEDEEELESEEEAFATTELIDGTVVEWDGDLSEGSELFIVIEDEREPAPDGTHETVEGLIVTVENGVVVDMEQREDDEDMEEDEEEVNLQSQIEELNERVEELFSAIEESNKKLAKLSKEPAVDDEKKKTVSNNFNKTKQKSRAAQILASGKK